MMKTKPVPCHSTENTFRQVVKNVCLTSVMNIANQTEINLNTGLSVLPNLFAHIVAHYQKKNYAYAFNLSFTTVAVEKKIL